jgi:hypothetical protein
MVFDVLLKLEKSSEGGEGLELQGGLRVCGLRSVVWVYVLDLASRVLVFKQTDMCDVFR